MKSCHHYNLENNTFQTKNETIWKFEIILHREKKKSTSRVKPLQVIFGKVLVKTDDKAIHRSNSTTTFAAYQIVFNLEAQTQKISLSLW